MLTEAEYQVHYHWMQQAIAVAKIAGQSGEIPVGAIIINGKGELLAVAGNRKEKQQDPTAHAEILAIRAASQQCNDWHLTDCTLYVTLEPCPMCAGAIIQARLKQVIYGADDPKTGVLRSVANFADAPFSNHRLTVFGGIAEQECRQLLQDWFLQKRRSPTG